MQNPPVTNSTHSPQQAALSNDFLAEWKTDSNPDTHTQTARFKVVITQCARNRPLNQRRVRENLDLAVKTTPCDQIISPKLNKTAFLPSLPQVGALAGLDGNFHGHSSDSFYKPIPPPPDCVLIFLQRVDGNTACMRTGCPNVPPPHQSPFSSGISFVNETDRRHDMPCALTWDRICWSLVKTDRFWLQ